MNLPGWPSARAGRFLALGAALALEACNSEAPREVAINVKTDERAEGPVAPHAAEAQEGEPPMPGDPEKVDQLQKIVKSEEEWRAQLSPEEYRVTREDGTERAFTGRYWNTKTPGTYQCLCCGLALFDSDTKYDSRSGWPSFYQPIEEEHILYEDDGSLGMSRTEVSCRRCGAHLGHVFEDGPRPTGLRYCINSASLRLKPQKDGSDGDSED